MPGQPIKEGAILIQFPILRGDEDGGGFPRGKRRVGVGEQSRGIKSRHPTALLDNCDVKTSFMHLSSFILYPLDSFEETNIHFKMN